MTEKKVQQVNIRSIDIWQICKASIIEKDVFSASSDGKIGHPYENNWSLIYASLSFIKITQSGLWSKMITFCK